MKTKIDSSKVEDALRSYTYDKQRYDESSKILFSTIELFKQELQKEIVDKRLVLPDGETCLKIGYERFVNITCVRGTITKVEPIIMVDIRDVQIDVPDEVRVEPQHDDAQDASRFNVEQISVDDYVEGNTETGSEFFLEENV